MRSTFALVMLVTLALAAPAARADCEVRGVASIDRLRVSAAGQRLRTLSVTDVPVAVRPGRGNAYREVHVLAPLAFVARTDAPIPWTVSRSGAFGEGMLWLTPAVDVEDVREQLEGDELVLRVQVDTGVWISRLHVPCDAVAVGHHEPHDDGPDWDLRAGPRWQPRGEDLWVMSEPGSGATIRLDAPDGLATPLVELEQRSGWIRVAARFGSGAVLRGWVRQHHLETVRPRAFEPTPFRRSVVVSPLPACSRGSPERDEYVGRAHVRTGAQVRTHPDGPAWATVSEPAVLTVSWRTGSPWVRIVHVPGLRADGRCPEVLEHAWVRRESVSLQGEPSAPGPPLPGQPE